MMNPPKRQVWCEKILALVSDDCIGPDLRFILPSSSGLGRSGSDGSESGGGEERKEAQNKACSETSFRWIKFWRRGKCSEKRCYCVRGEFSRIVV